MEKRHILLFPFSDVSRNSSIVLYGAGDAGQTFYHQIEKTGYCRILAWVDKRWNGLAGLSAPLAEPAALTDLPYDHVVIAASNPDVDREIREELVEAGVPPGKIVSSLDSTLNYTLCHAADIGSSASGNSNLDFARLLAGEFSFGGVGETKEPSEPSIMSSPQLKRVYSIGIVGTGWMAEQMAVTINRRLDNARLHAVVSRDPERGAAFALRHGMSRAYASCEELAADPGVDLVYITTPDSLHYPQTMLFLQNNKHVLCEKPVALSADEAGEMMDEAGRRGLLFADAMWPCYLPMARKLREITASGILGNVSTLTGNLYYHINPDRAKSGISLSNGIYLLSLASLVFGTDVRRMAASAILTDSGIDKQASITLFYDNAMAVLVCGMRAASDRCAYIYGDKAYAVIDNANEYKSVSIYSVSPNPSAPNTRIAQYSMPSGYEYEVRACLRAIEQGSCEPSEWRHEETLGVMRILDEVHRMIGVRY